MEFDHLGIAVVDIENELNRFEALGYTKQSVFEDPIQGVGGLFLTGNGPRIELLANLPGSKTLTPWLKNTDFRPYHLAFKTDSMAMSQLRLESIGSKLVKRPEKSVAFKDQEICFMSFSNIFLIELISR
jgi:methylmalonyl-CoA/ethylmalonyl-CoA epimerase